MEAQCEACGAPISGTGLTARFCSSRCRQLHLAASGERQSADVLLVQLSFALMNELTAGPVQPELIDELVHMRESWQRDIEQLRAKIRAQRDEQRRVTEAREEAKRRATERQQRSQQPKRLVAGRNISAAYRLLGLQVGASLEETQQAFRRLALRFHPDKNIDDPVAEERFKQINQAFHQIQTHLQHKRVGS